MKRSLKVSFLIFIAVLTFAFAGITDAQIAAQTTAQTGEQTPLRWWKGNLHTHSLWSDGDDYPEMIVEWYRGRGYHFLALSDHNILLHGQKWIDAAKSHGGMQAYEKYRARFGSEWVEQKDENGKLMVRLKPLSEFRHLFEEPGRMLLIQSEEISDKFGKLDIHLNATNLRDFIPPQGGNSVLEVMQNNVNAVLDQRKKTGQPMFPHLNHPNMGWAVSAEDLARVQGERFFEVYNGHPIVRNYGDADHPGTDRMWDIILTQRLAELGGEIMYGIAIDDTHKYHVQGPDKANAGRGWTMVRARRLTPESLIAAMEAGDFYASTGVRLKEIRFDGGRLSIEIEPEAGVTYTTQFIGTRRSYDKRTEPVIGQNGKELIGLHRYSKDVGATLAEVKGASPHYTLKGGEHYVRAKIISSKSQANPYKAGDLETAWTQPVVPKAK